LANNVSDSSITTYATAAGSATETSQSDNSGHFSNSRLQAASFAIDGTVDGAVPEPASWMLMIAGFGLVGFAARRRPAAVTAEACTISRPPTGNRARPLLFRGRDRIELR
jgi:hypothetical protein